MKEEGSKIKVGVVIEQVCKGVVSQNLVKPFREDTNRAVIVCLGSCPHEPIKTVSEVTKAAAKKPL